MPPADLRQLLRNTRQRLDDQVRRSEAAAETSPGSLIEAIQSEVLQGPRAHIQALRRLQGRSPRNLCRSLVELRNLASLDPLNPALAPALEYLLRQRRPQAAKALRSHCVGRDVVLHVSCRDRLERAHASLSSFGADSTDLAHVIVVGHRRSGVPRRLDVHWDGVVLALPVSDAYEALADKVFYAYMVLHLLAGPRAVIKLDDDHHLADAHRFRQFLDRLNSAAVPYAGHVLRGRSFQMPQGWHLGKCNRPQLHQMGAQVPFPAAYADGGFGYVLGPAGLDACARMYLSMQAFFNLDSVQLEDVFVGHAAQAAGLPLEDCFDGVPFPATSPLEQAALPGLKRAG